MGEAQLADMLGGRVKAGEKEKEQVEQVRIHVQGDKFSNSEAADAVWHRLFDGQTQPQKQKYEQGQERRGVKQQEEDVTVQVPEQPDHVETQRMLRGRSAVAAAMPAM